MWIYCFKVFDSIISARYKKDILNISIFLRHATMQHIDGDEG
jgi:hypothetical protein